MKNDKWDRYPIASNLKPSKSQGIIIDDRKIRVAIIGCGQISEAHIKEIKLINGAEIVAVCDLLRTLAEDLAERYVIHGVYEDFKAMIEFENLDVVHITTPPTTHLGIGLEVLQRGCHAYIEKPFGTSYREAERLIDSARLNQVVVCAGFSQLFDVVSVRFKEFFAKGQLGDVVHIESYYGDNLEGNFNRIFLNDKQHWIHKLPGKIFQNVISHALYHMTPFMDDPVNAMQCFTIDRSGRGGFFDELRVMMQSGSVSGYLNYTSGVRPITQFVKYYGTKGIAELDLANHAFRFHRPTHLPGPVARVVDSISYGKQSIIEGLRHSKDMWRGKDRFFAGMGNLISAFYDSIREGRLSPPVPYDEVLKASAIMDEIGRQCSQLEDARIAGGLN